MSQKLINTSIPNDGLGDALRDAFNDTNANFTELYSNKVDKVNGQGLTDNNLTDELLATILSNEENSQKNTQSDWLQNDSLQDDYIKNKPTLIDVKVPSKVNISFDFPVNAKTDLDSIHGTFLINGSESGSILNSTTPITGVGGVSKLMAIVNAGTVLTGSIIVTGTSVDRATGLETPGDTESIFVDGLSINNSTIDANGNQVHAYINNYISSKWWKGSLTFSTTDLDLTDIIFSQVAFEQFDDVEDLTIDSLDATYKISNSTAEMDAYMYIVEVNGSSANLTMISELHHEAGLEVDAVYRRKQKDLNVSIDGTTSGVFVDLFLNPTTQEYFSNFTLKTWATVRIPIGFYIDSTFIVDAITYGATLAAGQLAYLATDGKYYAADNSTVTTASTQIRLILEGGIVDDEKNALVKGKYSTGGLTAGNEYLGVNGGVTSTRPTGATDVVRLISTAVSTSVRYFNPGNTWVAGDGSNINGVPISGGVGVSQNIDQVLKVGNTTEEDQVFDKGGDAKVTITDEAVIATDTQNNRISEYKADKIVYINDGDTKELHLPQPLTLLESETIATQEWTVLEKINSIGYPELKDIFTTKINLGSGLNLDWDDAPLYYITLVATPTAITQTNYKIGMGKMLMLTGAFSYSIQHCDIIVDEGNYDGALWNLFQIFCIDDTIGSEKFTCNHIRTFAI